MRTCLFLYNIYNKEIVKEAAVACVDTVENAGNVLVPRLFRFFTDSETLVLTYGKAVDCREAFPQREIYP